MTQAERIMWARLRNNQLVYRFLRQYSIGYYIVDFYCPKFKLAVEIDGKYHEKTDTKLYDQERDAYLNNLGIKLLRFKNDDVLNNIENVLLQIRSFPYT